jgi:branched-chain amino acid transport system ATP-binding protein
MQSENTMTNLKTGRFIAALTGALAIAATALALNPTLLLLDEPTAGMSTAETERSIDLIRRIVRERGITLLFTEHDIHAVFSISDRILVLEQGTLIADGLPEEVRANEQVKRSYLGGKG